MENFELFAAHATMINLVEEVQPLLWFVTSCVCIVQLVSENTEVLLTVHTLQRLSTRFPFK